MVVITILIFFYSWMKLKLNAFMRQVFVWAMVPLRPHGLLFYRSRRRKTRKDDHYMYLQAAKRKRVESGEKMPFFFHTKEKNRHEVKEFLN